MLLKHLLTLFLILGFVSYSFAQTDDCASAPALTNCVAATGQNNLGFTNTGTDDSYTTGDICGGQIAHTAWYTFTPPTTGDYNVSFTNVDNVLHAAVLDGPCGGPYTSLGCATTNAAPTSFQFAGNAGSQVRLVVSTNSGVLVRWDVEICAVPCSAPDVPSVSSSSSSICMGQSTTLSWAVANLNDATQWHVYSGSCGGTLVGTTTLNSIVVSPTTTTQYFVRGEDGTGCVDESTGLCGSRTINVSPLDDAGFSYPASSYCVNDVDPSPTVTGLTGGNFSASPGGLSIAASSGNIDLSVSTPGTYTITYATTGVCPNSSNVSFTVNALDDPSFSYSSSSYCTSDTDPTPTITGLTGGSFSAIPGGLSISSSSGLIDLSASTPGSYTVTYTTAGSCPSSSNVAVSVSSGDDPSFSYSAAAYCVTDADPIPTITGLPGGSFSATPGGLNLNTLTGQIDVSTSTPGSYTVTYTTIGSCPASSNVAVTINGLDDPSFSYGASSYCSAESDPIPTITGVPLGSFSSSPGGLSLNTGNGQIDLSGSTSGSYTVTYTTAGSCPASSNVTVTVSSGPSAPSVTTPVTICDGEDVILSATGSGSGDLVFYDSSPTEINRYTMSSGFPTGTTNLGPLPVGTYTYTVTEDNGTCESAMSTINVTVNSLPAPPSGAGATICEGETASLSVTGVGTITWYSDPSLTSVVGTGTPFTTPVLTTNTDYYVTSNNSCEGPASTISVVVNPSPSDPVPVPASICSGETATLSATSSGGTTNWYSDAAGTMMVGTGTSYTTPVLTSTTDYYVREVSGSGCVSNLVSVTITVSSLPTSPTVVSPVNVCDGDDAVLNATGSGAGDLVFFDNTPTEINRVTMSMGVPTVTTNLGALAQGTYTYTVREDDGTCLSNPSTINVTVNAIPSVSYTALADLCLDAGVQTGLGGGTPTGGVYSGIGITDDGNGMTYSFDPAFAGPGTHTITYSYTDGNGCSASAQDDVEVFNLPMVTYTALADLCVDAGVQTGLGGGTPTGGVYSGTGVTDDGNGSTYSFDPAAAGLGTHTITYTFIDANGCSASAQDDVEVSDLPVVSFTALADLCLDAGVQTGLGGGTATGGVYAGPGVTDDGNGMTYSFDPAAAGVGIHTITYSFTNANGCTASAQDDVEVLGVDDASFSYSAGAYCTAGVDPTPTITGVTGGVFSAMPGGLSMSASTGTIDLDASTQGAYTVTYTTSGTCPSSSSVAVNISGAINVTDVQVACDSYTWPENGMTYTSSTNTPSVTYMSSVGCDSIVTLDLTITVVDVSVSLNNNQLTANAAGATYQWIDCNNGDAPIAGETNQTFTATVNGDYAVIVTQNSCVDTSACTSVVACDPPEVSFVILGTEPSFDFVSTVTGAGITYLWDFGDGTTSTDPNASHTYTSTGTFTVTLMVTNACGTNTSSQTITVTTTDIESQPDLISNVYPNPNNGHFIVELEDANMSYSLRILDLSGRVVLEKNSDVSNNRIELNLDAPSGVYFVEVSSSAGVVRKRIVKQH